MIVAIKKLHPDAQEPIYSSFGAACFDLVSVSNRKVVTPSMPQIFRTGLAFKIPDNYVMLVFSRSGHGFNHGVRLGNCVGIIDSDYRGEVTVKLTSDEHAAPLSIPKGARIAQAMIIPVEEVMFTVCDDLPETERGTNGFGSTGV